MSQRGEKYARQMDGRVARLEEAVERLGVDVTAQGVRTSVTGDVALQLAAEMRKLHRAEVAVSRSYRRLSAVLLFFAVLTGVMILLNAAARFQSPVVAMEPTPIPVAPLLELQALVDEPWEDPDEGSKIEAALVAQGYLREDVPLSYDLQDNLHTACEEFGVDYALALGVIEVESGFQVDAVSSAGCYGLMQLSPKYFPSGLSSAENIRTGVEFLGSLLTEYGDVEAALTAYNAGHDTGSRVYAGKVLVAADGWGEHGKRA